MKCHRLQVSENHIQTHVIFHCCFISFFGINNHFFFFFTINKIYLSDPDVENKRKKRGIGEQRSVKVDEREGEG